MFMSLEKLSSYSVHKIVSVDYEKSEIITIVINN